MLRHSRACWRQVVLASGAFYSDEPLFKARAHRGDEKGSDNNCGAMTTMPYDT